MSQRTLVLVKPDGVARGLVGEVLSRIERKGFRIVALELRTLDRATAERRLIDYLARKGHTGSSAREAARRALDGEGRASGGPSSRGLGAGRRPVEFH